MPNAAKSDDASCSLQPAECGEAGKGMPLSPKYSSASLPAVQVPSAPPAFLKQAAAQGASDVASFSTTSPRPIAHSIHRNLRMRRQNHSCDQCRRSKRACDAPPLELGRRHSTSDTSAASYGQSPDFHTVRQCSYCTKTKKICTMEWARSQLQYGGGPSTSSTTSQSRSKNTIASKRQRMTIDDDCVWRTADTVDEFDPGSASTILQDVAQIPALVFPDVSIPEIDISSALPGSFIDIPELNGELVEESSQGDLEESILDALAKASSDVSNSSETSAPPGALGFVMSPSTFQLPQPRVASHSTSSTNPQSLRAGKVWPASKRRRRSSGWSDYQSNSLSPFSIDQTMMARTNNDAISSNLLQIYHDVLEHNLSCWLTEVTCPYKSQRWIPDAAGTTDLSKEWGPFWSNRIYRRTVRLDRVAQSTGIIQLTRSEDRAALKALHLAIMSFATQWAQGSRRQRQRYSTTNMYGDNLAEDLAEEMNDEFDRNLQRHFWEQAQRALQEVSDLESYRVVCAECIFGLTQKPWSTEDYPGIIDPAVLSGSGGIKDVKAAIQSQVNGIISKEGPPTHLERAARKMHTLKYRYDAVRRGFDKKASSYKGQETGNPLPIGAEERGTIGLLYWLAVMFDTVSSSMNERPVVVTDEDCQHSSEQDDLFTADVDETSSGRWKIDMFIQDNLDKPGQLVHWPCSYEAAAEAVTRSAPIKVLLFRHVSYLQNILRKGGRGKKVEEIINNTTSVYRYWNMTYGSFFRELIQNFRTVPARIQSWFVCISAHWHLAALMLSDLVDLVDEHALGVENATRSRCNSKMAYRIREASVKELSDLASAATPDTEQTNSPVPQLPDFHHAVNEGTILTEPWTMLLIRAFSKASVILLGEVDESLRYGRGTLGHNSEDVRDNLQRAEECIKALWFLGKKSDMARKIAEVLSVASDGLKN